MTDEQPPVVESSWKPPMTDDRRATFVAVIWAAVVLVVITMLAVAPVVTVVSGTPKPVVAVALPSTPVAPTVTVTAAPPPPAPLPTVTVTAAPPPPVAEPKPVPATNEAQFVAAVHANIPTAWIPGGRPSDEQLVASGYQACRVIGQYPDNRRRAAYAFYEGLGFNASALLAEGYQHCWDFMDDAATYLCS